MLFTYESVELGPGNKKNTNTNGNKNMINFELAPPFSKLL